MTKKLLAFALFACCAMQLSAQDSTPKFVPVIAYWSLNDSLRYDVMKGVKKYNEGKMTDSTATKSKMTLVVADSTEKSYTVRVFSDIDMAALLDKGLTPKDIANMMKILDFPYLEYVTDEKGTLQEFKNMDKIYKAYCLLVDLIVKQETKDQAADVAKQMKTVIERLKSREHFNTLFCNEIQVMHKFYGLQYAVDSTILFETEMANPQKAGETLNIPNELVITMPDDWGGLLRLQNYMTMEGELALALIRGMYGEELLKKMEQDFKKAPPRYEVYLSYAIDPDLGQVYAMYQEITAYLGEQIILEKFTDITLADEE